METADGQQHPSTRQLPVIREPSGDGDPPDAVEEPEGAVRQNRSGANRLVGSPRSPLSVPAAGAAAHPPSSLRPAALGEEELLAMMKRQRLQAEAEEEFSSEDEEPGKRRRSTHINRKGLPAPIETEGWLNKRGGHQHRFKNWKRRWFILSYPFLMYFEAPQAGGNLDMAGNPLGRISVRGGCLVRNVTPNPRKETKKVVEVRFMLVSDRKTYFLQATSPEARKQWVDALNRSIYFANPAKRPEGVRYDVKYAGESCFIKVEMNQVTITNAEEQRKFHSVVQQITKVEHREHSNELLVEYIRAADVPGGTVRLTQQKTPLKTIRACLEGILQARDNLKALGRKYEEKAKGSNATRSK